VAADSLYFEKGRPSRPRNTEESAINRGKSSSSSRYRPFSRGIHLVIVPIDLFRPYLGESNGSGDGQASQARAARLRDEEEAERLYEEAVGQASSEQQAMQGLNPEGTNGRAATSIEDERELSEEQVPPGEDPTRPEPS
jgi:hypothetical protein